MSSKKKKNVPGPTKTTRAQSATNPGPVQKNETKANPWLIPGLLAGAAFFLYANTLGHGFVLDDPLVTTLNQYVQRGFTGWFDIFSHSYRAGSSVSTDSEYMYRPLSVAAFAAEWAIAPNTAGLHHLMNVLWYALTAIAMYFFLNRILPAGSRLLNIAVTALFIAHPLHTEVVANIKSRDEIMSFFFGIWCLSRYWDYVERGQKNARWWSMALFFLALLSKEGAAALLLIAPLTLLLAGKNNSILSVLKASMWLLIPFVIWFIIRLWVMGGKTGYTPDFNDNPLADAGLGDRWATGFVLLGKYLGMLFWPLQFSWDYSFRQIPLSNWSNWQVWLGLLTHVGLAVSAWTLRKRLPFFSLAASGYLAAIALYGNQLMLIGAMFGERLAYGASFWFCLGIGYLVWQALSVQPASDEKPFTGKNTLVFAGLMAGAALLYAARTIDRNGDWASNFTLFTADAQHAPESFRTLRAAGEQWLLQYAEKPGSPDTVLLNKAYNLFERSVAIRPTENGHLGLGNVAYFRKNHAEAVRQFEAGLTLAPNNALLKQRLALVYREWGQIEGQVNNNLPRAAELLEKSYRADSTELTTIRNLGTAYGLQNMHQKAIYYFEKALTLKPNDAELKRNLALAWRMSGNEEKARQYEQ